MIGAASDVSTPTSFIQALSATVTRQIGASATITYKYLEIDPVFAIAVDLDDHVVSFNRTL